MVSKMKSEESDNISESDVVPISGCRDQSLHAIKLNLQTEPFLDLLSDTSSERSLSKKAAWSALTHCSASLSFTINDILTFEAP